MPVRLRASLASFSRVAFLILSITGSATGSATGCATKDVSGRGCAADPFACPKGQTCWPIDAQGSFQCLPSKDFASKGEECELLPGRTACPDGMICLTSDTAPDAHMPKSYCAPFCDPARSDRGCGTGETCDSRPLFSGVSGSSVRACVQHDFSPKDMGAGN